MGFVLTGIQSHFNSLVDLGTLHQVRTLGFRLARIDAQTCSHETLVQMLADVAACDLQPLPIVADFERLWLIPTGMDCEWSNEPDGDVSPAEYRHELDVACAIALERGLKLWAPALSNLDEDSLKWLNQVRDAGAGGWPDGLHGVSVHSYGPFPHEGFSSRDAEVKWLKLACVGLPFLVSEFGLSTSEGVTEDAQAAFYVEEWAFWQRHGATAAIAYQLHSGPTNEREDQYGIRRFDGSWKPSAFTVPIALQESEMADATYCISKAGSFEVSPGTFCTYYPKGQTETILSIQADGTRETRPISSAGFPWETWRPSADGARAVFYDTAEVYAYPLVD